MYTNISCEYDNKYSKIIVSILGITECAASIILAVGVIVNLGKLLTRLGKINGFVSNFLELKRVQGGKND